MPSTAIDSSLFGNTFSSDAEALRKLCDPARYLGLSTTMVDRVLGKLH